MPISWSNPWDGHLVIYIDMKREESSKRHEEFMREAIRLATENVAKGGGPFGAVIVKDDQIIATGVNRVTAAHDPTAHAEVSAIRAAAQALKNFDLSGCTIYTSCEPCPMCLGAIYWARIDKIYYGNTKADAQAIDFDDSFIYDELAKPMHLRELQQIQLMAEEAIKSFDIWASKEDKTPY